MSTQLPGDGSPNPYASPTVETTPLLVSVIKEAAPLGKAQKKSLSGLKGWLILVGINLVLTTPSIIGRLFKVYSRADFNGVADAFIDPGSKFFTLQFQLHVLLDLASSVLFICMSIIAAMRFFDRHRDFPRYMILYYSLKICVYSVDTGLLIALPDPVLYSFTYGTYQQPPVSRGTLPQSPVPRRDFDSIRDMKRISQSNVDMASQLETLRLVLFLGLVANLAIYLIWIRYFLVSKRVKATFIK